MARSAFTYSLSSQVFSQIAEASKLIAELSSPAKSYLC
jgi:hypothetical protein